MISAVKKARPYRIGPQGCACGVQLGRSGVSAVRMAHPFIVALAGT